MNQTILEILYIISGVIITVCGVYTLKNKEGKKKITSSLFWFILGFIFIFGKHIPSYIVGFLLIILAILTLTKRISSDALKVANDEYRLKRAEKLNNLIFIPAISIGIGTLLFSKFTNFGGLISLGLGSILSLIVTLVVTKENIKYVPYESSRLLQQIGPNLILPQLLASLGGLFNVAGVGVVISGLMKNIIPEGNILFGIIGYALSMMIFTIVMGNAFAAFAVITAGIGYPFVIALGGNPVIVGALGLTSGYCGTLLTPMAANFNIIPATILEMENKNGVILAQLPIAIIMLIANIVFMYLLAF